MDTTTAVYSCDDHLDLSAVPHELCQSRLPRGLVERAPHRQEGGECRHCHHGGKRLVELDYAPEIPPSELFRRQAMATFEEDTLGAQLIPLLGADCCMWAWNS